MRSGEGKCHLGGRDSLLSMLRQGHLRRPLILRGHHVRSDGHCLLSRLHVQHVLVRTDGSVYGTTCIRYPVAGRRLCGHIGVDDALDRDVLLDVRGHLMVLDRALRPTSSAPRAVERVHSPRDGWPRPPPHHVRASRLADTHDLISQGWFLMLGYSCTW